MRPLMPALVFVLAAVSVTNGCATRPSNATVAPHTSITIEPTAAADRATLLVRLADLIAARAGAEVGVYYRDLASGDTIAINAHLSFHAASTMKVPVMIELFRRVDAGTLRLDQTLPVENRFTSIVDGSPFTLSANDDSDSTLYRVIGGRMTLRDLNTRMIIRSSNFATNLLIQLLDARTVTATARTLGARDIQVRRGVEDNKAFAAGLNNTTTARDLAVLMSAIETGSAASAASCAAMRDVLLHQEFNSEIPAGLPPGTPVAHKTGNITATLHDAAIVYPTGRRPYVLVVLTRKIPKTADAEALIAAISRELYAYAMRRG